MNPVELKYKTKHAEVRDSKGDIQYVLRDQAAHDCGRFLFLKDICRLEKYRTEKKETYGHGFAVFLTNDPLYMQQAKGLISRDLSLNCGICKGEKYLNTDAMWARQYKRFEIHDNYETVWHKVVLDGIEFFYLLIEVA